MTLQARQTQPRLATLRRAEALLGQVMAWRRAGETVGLVPTMGALHAGHLALVARARAECDRVVATLFVNPKQFDDPADLDSYPADEADDAARFAEAGVDLLFLPAVSEMYPDGFATTVSVAGLTDCLCGAARPGHFDGVATVVLLLFVIPLFDGFWGVVRGLPWFALGTLALVLAANWGAQVVVALAARRANPGIAGAAGLMWGNRNVSIYLAALPPDPLFGLYVALYQLPMLFTPLVLGRVLGGRGPGRNGS